MILSRDIGIDLGTATTMICDSKGRIIVREPSVVAEIGRASCRERV